MPRALLEYRKGWDAWSGVIPTDRKDMWRVFYNYYLNTIQDNDRSLQQIVDTGWRRTERISQREPDAAGATIGIQSRGRCPSAGSFAPTHLPSNSSGSRDIRNHACIM